jgi:hypothetical protein
LRLKQHRDPDPYTYARVISLAKTASQTRITSFHLGEGS